mgnify:FL=1
MLISPQDAGGDDSLDSDIDGNGQSGIVILTSGENNTTLDAGFYMASPDVASLGDYVWLDANADGVQDPTESPIEGVAVALYNGDGTSTGETTTTNALGFYEFTDLLPGDYYVVFTSPTDVDGVLLTQSPQDAGGDDSLDSDIGADGVSPTVTLGGGEHNPSLDAGYYAPASLGDYVWLDANADGLQDVTESPIEGVVAELYAADGMTTGLTTTTDATGYYEFTDLIPGDYYVIFTAPLDENNDTYLVSAQDAVGDDSLDSDIDSNGQSGVVSLTSGEHNPTIDAGFYPLPSLPVSLGDYVWLDENGDGVQDSDEMGIEGILVTLSDENGVVIDSVLTDENGNYLFDGLPAGTYTVSVPTTGLNDETLTTPESFTVTLAAGEEDLTLDFGYEPLPEPVTIGDYIWLDTNGDGVQDADETGLEGITVTLLDENGAIVETTVTDAEGNYIFNVAPGTYTVEVAAVTTDGETITTPSSITVTLAAGEEDLTLDLG